MATVDSIISALQGGSPGGSSNGTPTESTPPSSASTEESIIWQLQHGTKPTTNTTVSDILADQTPAAPTYSEKVQRLLDQQKQIEQSKAWSVDPKKRDPLAVRGWHEIQRQIDAELAYEPGRQFMSDTASKSPRRASDLLADTGYQRTESLEEQARKAMSGTAGAADIRQANQVAEMLAGIPIRSTDDFLNALYPNMAQIKENTQNAIDAKLAQSSETPTIRQQIDSADAQRNEKKRQVAELEIRIAQTIDPTLNAELVAQRDALAEEVTKLDAQIAGLQETLEANPDQQLIEEREDAQKRQQYASLGSQIQEYELALAMAYTPEAQNAIIEKLAPLKEQREALRIELGIPTFGERVGNVFKAGGAGVLSGWTDAQRALYEAGQPARNELYGYYIDSYQETVDYAKAQLQRYKDFYGEEAGTQLWYDEGWDNVLADAELKLGAFQTGLEAQPKSAEATAEIADQLQQVADEATQKAKVDLNGFESFLVDMGVNGVQMASDAAVNLAMGTPGSLAPIFFRSFGSGTQTARQAGADLNQQLIYGAAVGSVEALTEKMFDGLAGVYGKGMCDNMTNLILDKVAHEADPVVKKALIIFLGAAGEAAEEGVSGRLDPWLTAVYDEGEKLKATYGSGWEAYADSWADTGYDMLVGAAMGFAGSTVGVNSSYNEYVEWENEHNAPTPPSAPTATDVSDVLAVQQTPTENQTVIGTDIFGDTITTSADATSVEQARQIVNDPAQRQAFIDSHNISLPTDPTSAVKVVAEALMNETPAPTVAPALQDITPAQQALLDTISNGVTNKVAETIMNDPALKAEFESIADVVIEGTKSEQRNIVKNNADAVVSALTGAEDTAPTVDNAVAEEAESAPDVTAEEENPVVDALTGTEEAVEETAEEAPAEEPIQEKPAEKAEEGINAPTKTEAEESSLTQEATEEKTGTEEASEEREFTKAQEKLGDLLGLGEQITNEEIDTILDSKSLRRAMESFGFTFENGTLSEQREAVRAFAQDIAQNGVPSEEAVAKMRQDVDIQSNDQKLTYQLEKAIEERDAAREEGDIKARAAAQEQINKLKEQRKKNNLLGKVKALTTELTEGVTNNKKGNRSVKTVPTELKNATIDFLQSMQDAMIDPESKSAAKLKDKFSKINEKFRAIQETEERLDIEGRTFSEEVQSLMKEASALLSSGTPLSQMDSTQLQTITNALSAMERAVTTERSVTIKGEQRAAWQWGKDAQTQIEENGTKGDNIVTSVRMELSRARNFFKNLSGRMKNSITESLYNILNAGSHKTMEVKHQAHNFFQDLLAETSNYRTLRDEVTLKGLKDADGNTVKISRGMMLSLYMHLLNEQNANHIAGGGITVADIADYYRNRRGMGFGVGRQRVVGMSQEMNTLSYQLDAAQEKVKALKADGQSTVEAEAEVESIKAKMEDLKTSEAERMAGLLTEIEGKLTDYDKKFIAKTQEFFLWAQDQMNLTSDEVLGILAATEENYFPINSDPNFLSGAVDNVMDSPVFSKDIMDTLGITQQRTNGNNPIRLYDISDVINNYTNQMSKYCGILPAIREFNMVMKMKEAGNKSSLKDTIVSMYGEDSLKYINKLLNDMQGRGKGSNGLFERWIATSRGNFAASVLTLNARVAGSQFVSVFNAAPVLGWGNIAKAFTMKTGDPELIAKYSPLLQERTNNKDTHKFSDNRLDLASQRDRITRKFWFALNWISDVDNRAIRRLWPAAEAYVQQNSPDLEVGSDAYYQEVARMFNEAVERTQPSYNVLQRTALQRSNSDIVKSVFMFITQPMQNLNEVYDDIATAAKYAQDFKAGKNGVTEADVKAANKAAANSVTGLLVSAVALNALRGAIDMLMHRTRNYRDKDTGELTTESFLLRLMDYTAETIVGTLPGGAAVYRLAETLTNGGRYYGTSVAGVANVSDLVQDIVYAFRASEKNRPEAMLKAAEGVASVFTGMPIENAVKYVEGIINWVEDFQQNTFLESDYTYTVEQNKNQVYDALLNGNEEKAERAMERMGDNAKENVTAIVKQHYDLGDIDYDTSKSMLVAAGYDSDEADGKIMDWYADSVYETDRAKWEKDRDLTYDNSDLGRALARAKGSADFKAMDEDQQKKALDTIYSFYKHLAKKEYAEENGIEYENDTYEKFEDMSNPVEAIVRSRLWNDAVKNDDYDAINALISSVDQMSDEGREYFEDKNHVKHLEEAAALEEPIYAKDYFEIHDLASEWAKNDTEKKQNGIDNRDYDAMDDVIQALMPLFTDDNGELHNDTVDVFNGTYSHFDELIEAAQIGIDSKEWYRIRDEYVRLDSDDTLTPDQRNQKIHEFIDKETGLTEEQKALLKEHSTVFRNIPVSNSIYDKLVSAGEDPDIAFGYYDAISALLPDADHEDVTANQKAFVILNDSTRPASERVQLILDTEGSTLKPNQGTLARWLLQNFPQNVAESYWNKFKAKYGWKKSIGRAKNS